MTDSSGTDNRKPEHSGTSRRTGPALPSRAVTLCVFAAVLVAGLVLAVACGGSPGGGKGDGGQRADSSSRPHPAKPQRIWNRHPGSVAAVGDSITRGFDACSLLSDCTKVSWATGTDATVESLAARLADGPAGGDAKDSKDSKDGKGEKNGGDGKDGEGDGGDGNFATSGAVMADLPAQMRKAARSAPDLVTVMIGANDACRPSVQQMTSVEEFRAGFQEAMRTLRAAQPRTQVYVSSVPDLKRLWEQGRDNPIGRRVWGLGICQSMLKDPQAVDGAAQQRRQQVQDRVVAYNSVLKQECAKDLRCRYDNGAVFRYRFTEDELSRWDWFHPNKAGQRSLAELAYRQIVAKRPEG
ncbi:GDSL-type esterase/lipase family protein [Streptomyces cacaoi]